MTKTPKLTDRTALELHRARAAKAPEYFLFREMVADVQERLAEVNKQFTKPALVCGLPGAFEGLFANCTVTGDDETLALAQQTHDVVVHGGCLHWSDDPVGQLVQSRLALAPDGLFLAVFFGGQTLNELRTVLAEAEAKTKGGISPRVLPMGDIRDLGSLLQRAGFALPVADTRTVHVRYRQLSDLVRDLRGMGETNAQSSRHKMFGNRAMFGEAERLYHDHFTDEEGYLTATFEFAFLTGWAPDESQQKPLRPGSATQRLADALGTNEMSARDPVSPKES